MRHAFIVFPLLIAALGSSAACASSAGLSIGVEVLPARSAPALVADLPMPAFSQAMLHEGGAQAVAILHAGLPEAVAHFQGVMPTLGYRLVSDRSRGQLVVQQWSRGEDHVRIEFELAFGGAQPLVRMRSSGYTGPPAFAVR